MPDILALALPALFPDSPKSGRGSDLVFLMTSTQSHLQKLKITAKSVGTTENGLQDNFHYLQLSNSDMFVTVNLWETWPEQTPSIWAWCSGESEIVDMWHAKFISLLNTCDGIEADSLLCNLDHQVTRTVGYDIFISSNTVMDSLKKPETRQVWWSRPTAFILF